MIDIILQVLCSLLLHSIEFIIKTTSFLHGKSDNNIEINGT